MIVFMHPRPIPPVTIIPIVGVSQPRQLTPQPQSEASLNLREQYVNQFLLARKLSKNSQKAYRQDLQHFLKWTPTLWTEVTPRHIAQFRQYLMRKDLETDQRVLSDTTVARILGTLNNFYKWMVNEGHINQSPLSVIDKPKIKQPEAQYLDENQITAILQATAASNLPERNLALVALLLHGLRTTEICSLNYQDYDGQSLHIRDSDMNQQNQVLLSPEGKAALDAYLEWRQRLDKQISPESPLLVSHSRRNQGQRIGYDAIRKVMQLLESKTGLALNTFQFRHTFTSRLIMNGLPLEQVLALTRHKSTQSLRRYTTDVENEKVNTPKTILLD